MTEFWPSTHPSSRSLCRNASSRGGLSEGDIRLRKPIRGTFPAGCASAASGAARRLTARTATRAIITFTVFDEAERAQADDARLQIELKLRRTKQDHEVVLLEASSEDALRRTHGHHFQDP